MGLKCRMLQIAARRLNRLTQQYNVQGVAQILGSMVVAEPPVKPEGMTSVHSGVAIDTNGSATNGKVANSKQVRCMGACEAPDQEAMQRAEISHVQVRCFAYGTMQINKLEGGRDRLIVLMQEFMRVYDVLREDLLKDDLITDQPKFSADYMRKVNPI